MAEEVIKEEIKRRKEARKTQPKEDEKKELELPVDASEATKFIVEKIKKIDKVEKDLKETNENQADLRKKIDELKGDTELDELEKRALRLLIQRLQSQI